MTKARAGSAPASDADRIASPEEARALCASLTRTAVLLGELIDRETEVLAAGRAHEIDRYQGDKAELASRYLSDMTRLKRHAASVRSLASEDVERLKPLLQELGAKLLRNQDALAAVLALSERLIRTAAMKAIAADSGPAVYRRDAQVDTGRQANPAAALDRRL